MDVPDKTLYPLLLHSKTGEWRVFSGENERLERQDVYILILGRQSLNEKIILPFDHSSSEGYWSVSPHPELPFSSLAYYSILKSNNFMKM